MQVSELEEEASSLFERLSGLEEELGAAQAQAHSHAQALAAAQSEIGASHLPNGPLSVMLMSGLQPGAVWMCRSTIPTALSADLVHLAT